MLVWKFVAGFLAAAVCLFNLNSAAIATEAADGAFDYGGWFQSGVFISDSPLGIFISVILFAVFCYLSVLGISAYQKVENHTKNALPFDISIYSVFFVYFFLALAHYRVITPRGRPDPGFLNVAMDGLSGGLSGIYVVLFAIFGFVAFAYCVLLLLPYFLISVYSIFVTSKTADIANKHVDNKRPNDLIERQLADSMMTGYVSDVELLKIIHELSPIPRFLNKLTYKKKAEKYRKVRQLIDAQTEASNKRADVLMSAHELEMARRNER